MFFFNFIKNGVISIPDGRITYEKNGETFYIPYAKNDVNNPTEELKIGDHVSVMDMDFVCEFVLNLFRFCFFRSNS